jgi:CspA family cold shock protein
MRINKPWKYMLLVGNFLFLDGYYLPAADGKGAAENPPVNYVNYLTADAVYLFHSAQMYKGQTLLKKKCAEIVKFPNMFKFAHHSSINSNSMKTGKVKFFNEAKGYGFIVEDESNKEIFIHHSGLVDKVRENDLVSYDVIEGRKGLNAVNVKKVQ